jgi:hypothetical protein
MFGTLVSAAFVCAFALVTGQVALRLCGAERWTWLAPAAGMSILMLGAVPALYIPGRSVTAGVLLLLLLAGCAVAVVRDPGLRPPLTTLAAAPAALLALVPFGSAGTAGTLGVSLNNDMGSHLRWAEAYGSETVARVTEIEPGYPVGPHAVVAAINHTLGIATEEAFAGLTLACVVLLAWTALGTLGRRGLVQSTFIATVAGVPFIVAGYYGQGSFKELLQAVFVLALVGALMRRESFEPRFRWVPPALFVAGTLSVYSVPGLAWPAAIVGVWAAGLAVERLVRRRTLRGAGDPVRAELMPLLIGAAALVVVLVPQAARIGRFIDANVGTNATGIDTTDLGNLAGPLSFWEAFGAWDIPDYRFPPLDPFTVGMWTAGVLALVLAGAVWWVRRGDWLLPAAAAASVLIWWVSDRTQSPYVTAKALVMLSPMLMLLAARPLAEIPFGDLEGSRAPPARGSTEGSLARPARGSAGWPPALRLATGGVAVVFAIQIVGSSWDALRVGPVGPQAHLHELRELRPLLGGRQTLFLGNDDFIRWELAGVPVNAPSIGYLGIDTRPEKAWEYGQPFDFDSLAETELNKYDWIITPRDAAGSQPPDGVRLERRTRNFALWRRTGEIPARELLAEGPSAAARLRCSSRSGRRIVRNGGVAAVRRPTVSAPLGAVAAGGIAAVPLRLSEGTWDLQAPYVSQHPIDVDVAGLRTTLPASLDRPGTRWPIGRIEVTEPGTVTVHLYVHKKRLTLPGAAVSIDGILATPANPTRVVPIREACGQLVDWYRHQ